MSRDQTSCQQFNAMNDYLIKIDPYLETIQQIDFSDSHAYLAKQLGARHMGVYAKQPYLDAAMMNAQALETDLVPAAWLYLPTNQVYYGPAIWVNISEVGELRVPLKRVDQLLDEIEFLGFIESDVSYLPIDESLLEDPDNEAGDEPMPDVEF